MIGTLVEPIGLGMVGATDAMLNTCTLVKAVSYRVNKLTLLIRDDDLWPSMAAKRGGEKVGHPNSSFVWKRCSLWPLAKIICGSDDVLMATGVSGSGPIRSMPICFHTSVTGMGWSSGCCLLNLLFTLWQTSQCLQYSITSFVIAFQ